MAFVERELNRLGEDCAVPLMSPLSVMCDLFIDPPHERCDCCECAGRLCHVPHPGHSHHDLSWVLDGGTDRDLCDDAAGGFAKPQMKGLLEQ